MKFKNKKTSVKVLVVYHKKDKLYKNDILVPIHAGRALALEASKDGKLSQDDYKWLLKNTIGDDTGDNISTQNRELNEITAIYWAWKNYDKLGNPDYIGLNHYRRFFYINYSRFDNLLRNFDFIKMGFFWDVKISVYDAWIKFRHEWSDDNYLKKTFAISYDVLGNNSVEEYFKTGLDRDSYFNMFLLPKEDFFRYCNFLFSIILKLPSNGMRTKAMIAERLTAYYLSNLAKQKKAYNACLSSRPYKNLFFISKLYAGLEKFLRKIHLIWLINCS